MMDPWGELGQATGQAGATQLDREFWKLVVRHLKGIVAAIVKYRLSDDRDTPTRDVKVKWQDAPDEALFEEP